MNSKLCSLLIVIALISTLAAGDTLVLKNGSVIKGKFMGGTENEITFQVGSSSQKYNVADIASLKFEADTAASDMPTRPKKSFSEESETASTTRTKEHITIPAGTVIAVRTIDSIDSTKSHPGDRFTASLEEALMVDENVIVAKGADVYGRLAEAKASGTFTGRSELHLELTGIVIDGKTVPLVTGEYELTGKSRGASTAKRTAGGAAVGAVIGALAGGGKGAAIGAAAGGGLGAGSEVITKGDQVKVPSETLIDFTLRQDLSIPKT